MSDSVKKKNREVLERIADNLGDLYLMEMFWDMFSDLSATKQKYYIERAERIEQNHLKEQRR